MNRNRSKKPLNSRWGLTLLFLPRQNRNDIDRQLLLLMPVHSKPAQQAASNFLTQLLLGNNKRKMVSATILLIIAFLLHIKNKKTDLQSLKNSRVPEAKDKKKVVQLITQGGKGHVDAVFWKRIKKLIRIVIPSWHSPEVGDLLLLTIFLIARTFLSIYMASVNGGIVNAIVQRNLSLFITRIIGLGMIAIPASFVNSFLDFLNKKLALRFRRRLTDFFHMTYLKDMIFYQLGNLDSRISNPDQRLTADIEKWANSLSTIYSNFTKPTLDIILFSKKLAEIIGWMGPSIVILWYLLSGFLLKIVSPPFGKLIAGEQRLQGEYRAAQTDLVHHAEEIAFFRGNEWEKTRINNIFYKFIKHSEGIMNKKLYMGVFDSMLVKYGAFMVGYGVLGLPVFGSNAEEYNKNVGEDAGALTRDYVRNSSLLINLAKAIGKLVVSFKEVQHLAGYTTLIYQMKEVLADLDKGSFVRTQVVDKHTVQRSSSLNEIQKGVTEETDDYIVFDRVPIVSPNGDVLVKEISFQIERGMSTVISGPNGCGKSSLFRILSGLWPLAGGVLRRPHMDKLFYIPQRPYLPPGTLRDQIIYPHSKDRITRDDEEIRKLLGWVKLDYIEEREKGFDSVNDWNDVLSGGEKQRIAMARLFYHCPLFAILDECTSAMSMDVQAQLYNKAKELGITLFTVSHRSSLFKYHQYMLKFDGRGNYEMTKLTHQ